MNTLVNAIKNTPYALTENGAATFATSGKSIVDLFFAVGSAKAGKSERLDAISLYTTAVSEDYERAVRTMLWMRDIREGAGRRKAFRDWLNYLEENDKETLSFVIDLVPELGRWDDLLVFKTPEAQERAYNLVRNALNASNGLCAKWMPRKGAEAAQLRNALGISPKSYRKLLVSLTKVVETPMCAKDWTAINYSHVPSVAAARYRKAFSKNDTERFGAYIEELKKPVEQRDPKVKINATAIYPFDVIKGVSQYDAKLTSHVQAQWEALPNFVPEGKHILPVVDVSGSMKSSVQGNVTAMNVSTSLGMYLSERNTGAFKNLVLTFSEDSHFVELQGNVQNRLNQILHMPWGMNTNLQSVFDAILKLAKQNNVPQEDMPTHLLIISDMEFDSCTSDRRTNYQVAAQKFADAGYAIPNVVFWNVNGRTGNSPVRVSDNGVALVSGFSPTIAKSVLTADKLDPLSIVDATIMKDRYAFRKAA